MSEEGTMRFPIHSGGGERGRAQRRAFGEWVPWETIEVVREEAMREHGQTLERLAERGGLSWGEIGNLFVNHHSGTRWKDRRD